MWIRRTSSRWRNGAARSSAASHPRRVLLFAHHADVHARPREVRGDLDVGDRDDRAVEGRVLDAAVQQLGDLRLQQVGDLLHAAAHAGVPMVAGRALLTHLLHVVRDDLVALLELVEAIEHDPALEAGRHLAYVLLEALEGVDARFVRDRAVANHPRL